MTLSELIAKLEAAEEGSRELDAEIAIAVNDHPKGWRRGELAWASASWWAKEPAHNPERWDAPNYSTSLDAALSLVPEGCDWLVNGRGNYACVWEAKETGRDGRWEANGCRSPALSLTVAALRAIQHMGREGK